MTKEFEKFLSLIKCKVICIFGGKSYEYDNGKDALDHIGNSYDIESIYTSNEAIIISLIENNSVLNDLNAEWALEHKSKSGLLPDIFDGA